MFSSSQDVFSLPLAPYIRQCLISGGLLYARDIHALTDEEVIRRAGLRQEEVEEVRLISGHQGGGLPGAVDAYKILALERASTRIVTCSREIDSITGGGIGSGRVTEVCGVPGVGKTQLCIQLAVNVQVPTCLGGVQGGAIYIDTEGSFDIDRMAQMAQAAVRQVQLIAASSSETTTHEIREVFNEESILANLIYFRVLDFGQQLAVVNMLPLLLQKHPKVKLVVIDSMAFHFRQDVDDMVQRTRLLSQVSQNLQDIAEQHDLALVVTNHVTLKSTTSITGEGDLVPALGESWSHAASSHLLLKWQGHERQAILVKSPDMPEGCARFQVTPQGIEAANHSQACAVQFILRPLPFTSTSGRGTPSRILPPTMSPHLFP